VAAIKGAQIGLKTACIDKRGPPGGTCLNVGCIPSKALLNNSHIYHQIMHDTKGRGIEVSDAKINFEQFMKSKDTAVAGLTKGVESLFKKNKVDYYKGEATFAGEHDVDVKMNEGNDVKLSGKNIIIATGSEASPFPGLEIDEERIVSSTGAIDLKEVPKKMIVIGGGIIGLELGSVWSRLGTEVTVVEYLGAVGAGMDADMSKMIQRILAKQGLKFKVNTKVLSGKRNGDTVSVDVEAAKGGKKETLEADIVLVAIGRRPYTQGLGLDKIGIETDEKGRVIMDEEYRTKLPHVRVIGDCTYGPMLAHKAEDEGIVVAEAVANNTKPHINYGAIPSVMYTHPEVAWVGQTEQSVKEKYGKDYRVGIFPFVANSRAKTNLDTDGQIKVIAEKDTDRILGVHMVGPSAGELIAEATLAIEYGASSEDIARTTHAHPTLAEAFKEACMATSSKAIHF